MQDRDYVRLMAEYNVWMNERVYAACRGLSDEERKRDRGAFFKSVHGTLDHIVHIDRLFMSSLLGWGLTLGPLDQLVFSDFDALHTERVRLDQALLDYARDLQEGALAERRDSRNPISKRRRIMPRYLTIVQMFNHQTHHRGQLTTLLAQLGLDIGSTDLPWLPYTDTICEDLPD